MHAGSRCRRQEGQLPQFCLVLSSHTRAMDNSRQAGAACPPWVVGPGVVGRTVLGRLAQQLQVDNLGEGPGDGAAKGAGCKVPMSSAVQRQETSFTLPCGGQ